MKRIVNTDFKEKWGLFSVEKNSNIAEFKSKHDLVNFLAYQDIYEGKLNAIATLIFQLHNSTVNGRLCFENTLTEALEAYNLWRVSIENSATYEEYYKKIDDKLNELLKPIEEEVALKVQR